MQNIFALSLDEMVASGDYGTAVAPLIGLIIALLVYTAATYLFASHVARKNVVKRDLQNYSKGFHGFLKIVLKIIFFIIQDVILAPVFMILWLVVITAMMLILSHNSAQSTLLICFSIIAVIRIMAYIREAIAIEMAKLIPFTILGYAFADVSYFTVDNTINVASNIYSLSNTVIYYLIFVVGLEIILRLLDLIIHLFIHQPVMEEADD